MTGFPNCKPGCIKCCTDTGIELSLFDFFRNWVYQNLEEGRKRKFSQVVNQFWNTKMLIGVPVVDNGKQTGYTAQFVTQPCPGLDTQKNNCRIYHQARPYCCETFPDAFLEGTEILPMNDLEKKFFGSLPCTQDYQPTPERQAFVKEALQASFREAKFGWAILNSAQQITGNREQVQREVLRRLRVFDDPRYMEKLWQNLTMNPQIMKDYCRLMSIDSKIAELYTTDAWRKAHF